MAPFPLIEFLSLGLLLRCCFNASGPEFVVFDDGRHASQFLPNESQDFNSMSAEDDPPGRMVFSSCTFLCTPPLLHLVLFHSISQIDLYAA